MKRFAIFLGMVLMALALAQPKELRVFIWSEYIDPEIPKQFTKATGIPIRITLYESNEDMLARLQAGGAAQFDLIVPSHYIIPTLVNLKLVQPLQLAKIPNIKNLEPRMRNPSFDPGNKYSIAYQYSFTGLFYRKDRFPTPPSSWSVVFNTPSTPFTLIDDQREMFGIALRLQGQSINSRDPNAIRKAGMAIREVTRNRNFLSFEPGIPGINKVLAGQASMAIVYNGDAVRTIAENPNMAFVLPKEGGNLSVDSMMIPAKAPNAEAAHRFINYILEPKVGAQLSNWTRFGTPNAASKPFIRPEDLKNPAIYPDLTKLDYILDLGRDQRVYDEVWTAIRAR